MVIQYKAVLHVLEIYMLSERFLSGPPSAWFPLLLTISLLSDSPTLSCMLSHTIQQNIRWQGSMGTYHPTFCGLPAVIQSCSTVALSWAGWRWDRVGFGPVPSAENSRLLQALCQSIWHLPCWIQVAFYPRVSGMHAWLKPLTWFTFQFSRSFHLPKI